MADVAARLATPRRSRLPPLLLVERGEAAERSASAVASRARVRPTPRASTAITRRADLSSSNRSLRGSPRSRRRPSSCRRARQLGQGRPRSRRCHHRPSLNHPRVRRTAVIPPAPLITRHHLSSTRTRRWKNRSGWRRASRSPNERVHRLKRRPASSAHRTQSRTPSRDFRSHPPPRAPLTARRRAAAAAAAHRSTSARVAGACVEPS